MFINWALGELHLKIVYAGPAQSGKTANLHHIHARTPARQRGELMSLKMQRAQSSYYDFLQIDMGQVNHLRLKVKLFTVPGQEALRDSRRLILQGADAAVFVADAQAHRAAENLEAWYTLQQHVLELGHTLAAFPLIVQANKCDLPHTLALPALCRYLQLQARHQCFVAAATQGTGVFETLKAAITSGLQQVKQPMPVQNERIPLPA